MKRTRVLQLHGSPILGWLLSVIFLSLSPLAYGQDTEPNNPCTSAQDLGAVALPFVQEGELVDLDPDPDDVDFFRLEGTPGAIIRVDLEGAATGAGTLEDPFLGFFDSACNPLLLDDDGGVGFNSRLIITVPVDGVFVLGVTRCCDGDFSSGGIGTYRLTLARFQSIGSIRGRVVDAVTGAPLPGGTDPFASVSLLRCEEFGCDFVNDVPADGSGRYQFSVDFSGQRLEVGTYQVLASADQYQSGQTEPFAVGEGEDRDVGDLRLQPNPIQFSNVVPCADIPPAGGRCRYSVTVRNRADRLKDGLAWSIVDGSGIGSVISFTQFQAKQTHRLNLKIGESRIVHFGFKVPSSVADFASICTVARVGADPVEPSFQVIGDRFLFCIQKQPSGAFSVIPEKEARKHMRRGRSHRE
ncbi:MAG: carboxypeptidase-like regulatory domain-containing protein [Gammaproteobacteria bacterium]